MSFLNDITDNHAEFSLSKSIIKSALNKRLTAVDVAGNYAKAKTKSGLRRKLTKPYTNLKQWPRMLPVRTALPLLGMSPTVQRIVNNRYQALY